MSPYIKSLPRLVGETAGQFDLKLKFYHRLRGFLVIFLHLVWFSLCSSLFWEYYCKTMNFYPKVPLVKFIFKNKVWSTGLRIKINNKMEILLPPMEGVGGGGGGGGGFGNERTAVKQVSIVHLFFLHSNTWITSSLISDGVRTPQKYCKKLIQTWRNYRKLGKRKWNYETRPWEYVEKETVLTSLHHYWKRAH